MSLKIYAPSPGRKAERPNIAQRVAAIFGLAGLVLAWAVVLLPCAVWLLFNLVFNRPQDAPARQQA
ncbi:hypothetical protein [Caulobacter sp. BK020]|uniref:hypothetical protein n=1 Tax=Caulobacter sp. BK020 TaxID=2512117 RepID=UPI0010432B81|nr:hypothetical protein [Caulobacter sp. BK020]TCS12485.1 hypothetical protein EV278_113105 [Caulobacter sp. BK020]